MARAYPAAFRNDVVAVARKHEAPISQIARDFEVSEATLHSWLKKAGHVVSERPVWRRCSEQWIWSSFVKKSRSGKKPGPLLHNDLVPRDSSVSAINQL